MFIFSLFSLLACGGKITPPANEITATETTEKPTGPLQLQTSQLLTKGVLDPVPKEAAKDFTVRFRTLYPNGCWTQSTPQIVISKNNITHSYTTKYEGKGRMCTMAFKRGGLEHEVSPPPGKYNGFILVDDTIRATYQINITGL